MKQFKVLIPLLAAGALLSSIVFAPSCANTKTPPSGGPKDTIPPVLINVSPLPGTLNVPVHNLQIVFTFNEYVTIKERGNICLSPPTEKPLKSKLKGKSVVVSFDGEDLLPSTTYTIDITGAIVDNNEGNKFPGYALTFSTGDRIDSMYVTGIVQDCSTLNPIKGASVMLYKDQADSAIFLHRPDAVVKTDDWGFFCLRNVQDTVYRLYAIKDENGNNIYEPETESVAFEDSLVVPQHKVADGVYELYKFDMLDTAACLRRHNDYELNLFRETPTKQFIMDKGRTGERSAFVKFMAPFVQIKSLSFKGISKKKILTQFNPLRDSLLLWINDQRKQKDTLYLDVNYMKTDSTGKLVPTLEKLKLPRDKASLAKAMNKSRKDLKHEDTIAVFKTEASGETFEQYGIAYTFTNPLIEEHFDSLRYEIYNPRQQKETGKFTWSRDTADIRRYIIRPAGKILPGYEHVFFLPYRKFRDVNGYWNDSTKVSVKLPDDDKLSNMTVNVSGVTGSYVIDLMTEKRDKVLRSYIVHKDGEYPFPYLKEGKYCLRITEDKNGNNMVETGDLLRHKQPEKVRFYKLKDGTFLIQVMASAEISQDINLTELFK